MTRRHTYRTMADQPDLTRPEAVELLCSEVESLHKDMLRAGATDSSGSLGRKIPRTLRTQAARIAELEAEVARLRDALTALDKAASEVARRGAETGPQWAKLTIASLKARAVLQEKPHD